MYDGRIWLHRKMLEWEWYDDPKTKSLFIHLLLLANWKDKKWRGIEIKRGQLVASQHKLSVNLGLSRQELRSCLVRLKSTNEITIKSTKTYTLITVNKYDTYQTSSEVEQPREQPREQPTSNQASTNEQPLLRKTIKKRSNTTNVHFDEFWSCYDKKIGREKCYRWYMKNGSNGVHPLIMNGIKKWRESGRWDDKQYQHHPYTFLFNKMWEDDPGVKKVEGGVDEEFTRKFIRGEI